MSTTALARTAPAAVGNPATAIRTREDLEFWAHHAMRCGFFKGAEDMSRGIIKIAFGLEYNLTPMQALSSVHIIEGKPSLPGNVLAGLIDNSDRYKYRVEEKSDERCTLRFFKRDPDTREWDDLGVETFTIQDAERAQLLGKDNWRKYPSKMLFWRALSNGFDFYCAGLQVAKAYVHDELGSETVTDDEVEYVEAIDVTPSGDGAPTAPPEATSPEGATSVFADPKVQKALDIIGVSRASALQALAVEAYGPEAEAKEAALSAYYSGGRYTLFANLNMEHYAAIESGLQEAVRKNEAAQEPPASEPVPRAAEEGGPLPTEADLSEWLLPEGEEPADKAAHAKARKRVMAEGKKQFGDKAWDGDKGKQNGLRHRFISEITLGRATSATRLRTAGLEELLAKVHRESAKGVEVDDDPIPGDREERAREGDPAAIFALLDASPLQDFALRYVGERAARPIPEEGHQTEEESLAWIAGLPEAARQRLGEIVADDAAARAFNDTAFVALIEAGDPADEGLRTEAREAWTALQGAGHFSDPGAVGQKLAAHFAPQTR